MTAAHEFGHVLGLGPREPAVRADEQRVRVPLPPAAARVGVVLLAAARRRPARRPAAVRRHASARPATSFCESRTLPGTVRSLGDAADPVDSLARVRLSFQTPSSTTLRRVIVTRRRGRRLRRHAASRGPCRSCSARARRRASARWWPRSRPRPALGGDRGRGPRRHRQRHVVLRRVHARPPEPVAHRRPAHRDARHRGAAREADRPGGGARGADRASPLQWTNPRTPPTGVQVLRAPGACPANPQTLPPYASARHQGRRRDVHRRGGRAGHVVLRPAVRHGAARCAAARRDRPGRACLITRSPVCRDTLYMPSRSTGMHIHGTRVGATRFRRH